MQIQTESLFGREDDPDREDRHRVIELPSGNKVHFKAEDPYGFVRINFDKGPTPEHLSGSYTSFTEAQRAIDAHLISREFKQQVALENQRVPKVKLTPRIKDASETNET